MIYFMMKMAILGHMMCIINLYRRKSRKIGRFRNIFYRLTFSFSKNLLLRSKAFFMSSVSKEDQHRIMYGIKEKLEKPGVGRYKPKYESVERKPMVFEYRKTPTKRRTINHQKVHSMK